MRIAVIGAGPSGLVMLKYLLQSDKFLGTDKVDAVLFEAEDSIGGTFTYRTYERAELVSSHYLTSFSDFPVPIDSPDFLSTKNYCKYLEDYCTAFELWPHIRLSTSVKSIRRSEKGGHSIRVQRKDADAGEEVLHFDAVAICTGLHVTPNIPPLPGIDSVSTHFHSSTFKECHQFGRDTNVLILGAGETAMDLAYLAVTSPTKSVTLCHRSGWTNAPKRFPDPIKNGNMGEWLEANDKFGPMPPTDCGSASLFDTAYVHPWVEQSGILWDYYDKFTKLSAWIVSGTFAGIGQWVGEIPEERHYMRKVIPNKSNNAMPYISAPYKPKVQTRREYKRSQRLSLPPIDLQGRQIDLAPWPSHIDQTTGHIEFQDTNRPESEGMRRVQLKPDVVVFATGYTQTFPFLDESYPTPESADVRRIWSSSQPDVGFIGFVRPNFGAIPPLSELQAQLWLLHLLCPHPPPPPIPDTSYYLTVSADRRIQYGVDHDTYAYRLALDMQSAPSLLQILSHFSPKLLGTWALGPNFNAKFRITGPWRDAGAARIMETVLWDVVRRRRGWFVWTWLTIVPMVVFGWLSAVCFVVDLGLRPITFATRKGRKVLGGL